MTKLSEADERSLLQTVRRGLSEAAALVDVANYTGDKPPYSSGYDDVHDAANAVWAALRALDILLAGRAALAEDGR